MNKILISPFTMGPIAKGQELIIDGEYPFGYNFKGIAGLWDKELFDPKPIKCRPFNDGSHDYLIPESIYEKYKSLLNEFDEDAADLSEFDDIFGKYRIDGSTQLFRYG